MWFTLFVLSAHALETTATLPLDTPATDVEVTDAGGVTQIFVASADGVTVLSAAGVVLGTLAAPAQTLLFRDPDADGVDDLIVCGDSGLGVATGASGYWDVGWLSTDPCLAVTEQTLDGATGIAAAGSTAVTLWWDDGLGGLVDPEDAGLVLTGAPLLAATEGALAAATVDDPALQVLDPWGVSSLAAGGAVTGLVAAEDWIVSLGDRDQVRDWTSGTVDVADGPGALALGDVDADGAADLLVLHADLDLLGVLSADGVETTLTGPDGATGLAVGDLDGDPCADLVVRSEDSTGSWLTLMTTPTCGLDADGDGYSAAEGDCDDGDPALYPSAEDSCDGLDNDCDGWVDGLTRLEIIGEQRLDEGDTALFYADVDGCAEGVIYTWSTDRDDIVNCSPDDLDEPCALLDDGALVVAVEASAADGSGSLTATLDVQVDNLPPTLTISDAWWDDDFSDGSLTMYAGTTYTADWRFDDVAADPIELRVEGGPSGLQLSPSGALVINADVAGSYVFTVTLEDDDGGSTVSEFHLDVLSSDDTGASEDHMSACASTDPSCGGGCCGTSSLALVGLLGLGLRRRPS